MKKKPRISFGIIVLNGQPFVRYNLRSLYRFAHEIIVVEGAVQGAKKIATNDGHSLDGTLESLYKFKAEEDHENKIKIVIRNGFWKEKKEMSLAYAERASGDYLWQVDIDEFYKSKDIQMIIEMLSKDSEIFAISFSYKQRHSKELLMAKKLARQFKVKEHKIFVRDDDDILYELPINFTQAALGTEVELPTLNGNVKLKIPAGSQTGQVFRLKNKGIPHLRSRGQGDQLVKLLVVTPKSLTKKQRQLFEELSKDLGSAEKTK